MVSRRDELLQALGQAVDNFRAGYSQDPQPTQQHPSQRQQQQQQHPQSLPDQLFNTVQRVFNGAQSAYGSVATPSPNYVSAVPQPPPPQPQPIQPIQPPQDTDQLPEYSAAIREPPVPLSQPKTTHTFRSHSGKLELSLFDARGSPRAPVYVQSQNQTVTGQVRLLLDRQEPVTNLRIRLKGVVRTKLHIRSHHPTIDEYIILENGTAVAFPEEGLSGVHVFPFSFTFSNESNPYHNQSEDPDLPPSFVLPSPASPTGGYSEAASVKYYIKVTMARKGLWRANDRMFVPVVYLTRHPPPPMSPLRQQAIEASTPIPGPNQDPSGWTNQNAVQKIRKGMFARNTVASYQVFVYVPQPNIVSRNMPVQFYLRLLSTDPSVTTTFPIDYINVQLIQRASLSAQGQMASIDTVVATGQLTADGPPDGSPTSNDAPYTWCKSIFGEFRLGPAVPPSFNTNLVKISYIARVHITCSGMGNNCVVAIPLKVISSPSSKVVDQQPYDLPPSYFEVMENDGKKSNFGTGKGEKG